MDNKQIKQIRKMFVNLLDNATGVCTEAYDSLIQFTENHSIEDELSDITQLIECTDGMYYLPSTHNIAV